MDTLKNFCINKEETIFQDSFSEEIWACTYKDHADNNVNDTLYRVAKAVASAEDTEENKEKYTIEFYDMLTNFKATSGGRIYANAGADWQGTTLMNCLSGETKVVTKTGIYSAKSLAGKTIEVLTSEGKYSIVNWSEYGEQKLIKLMFSNGETIFTTENHDWIVSTNVGVEKVQSKNLVGRQVALNGVLDYQYKSNDEYIAGVQNGLIFGDGYTYTDFTKGERYSALQQFNDSRHLVIDYFGYAKVTNYKGDDEGIHYVSGLPESLKSVPNNDMSTDYLRGFIAGVIASDGHVDARGSVCLHTANYEYALQIKDIAVRLGLPVVSLRLERENSPFDGKKSELWKLTFVKKYFYNDSKLIIKNSHKENMKKSSEPTSRSTIKCISVEPTDRYETVYCCDEPTTHTFTLGEFGLLTGNCFVGPRENYDIDSLNGILAHLKSQANTLKSEGGWGENFSYIRPRGSFIAGIGVETPGAVKYMELFDKASDIITSGAGKKSTNPKAKGKIRKGAMMGVLDVWHPDIIEFITAKQQPGRLSKFNISVNCSDEFMSRVIKLKDLDKASTEYAELDNWKLIFPDTAHEEYAKEWDGNIKNWVNKGFPVVVHQETSVTMLWNMIMDSTYNRAEPGVLFLDRANYFAPLNYAEYISATNPCGEQMLAPGGVCNLGSINATQFINSEFTDFNYDEIARVVRILVRFLDNVNTLTNAPLPEYEYSIKNKRRVGVGILGWASALYMLQTRFASPKADEFRERIMSTIARAAYETSIDLAIEKGMFSICDPIKHADNVFIKSLGLSDEYMQKLSTTGIRNSSLLSIQPTGNTSIFANIASGGLEPVFSHEYIRTVIVNHMPDEIRDITPKWYEGEWYENSAFKFAKEGDEEILRGEINGIVYKIDKNRGLTKEVLCEDYGVRAMKQCGLWDASADWAATAMNMNVNDHISDLTGFARWIDSAISKTVNCPNDYPLDKFKDIYLDAYKSGYVKGVTTYRSGTMTSVLSSVDEKTADANDDEIILQEIKLPNSSPATVKTLKAEGRKWYLTVVWNENQTRPFALFCHTNSHEKNIITNDAIDNLLELAKNKGIPEKYIEDTKQKIINDNNTTKLTRVISLNLRHGVLIKNIVSALNKVDDIRVGTFLFQIKKFLSSFINDGEKVENETCSECGSDNVVYSEGCQKCMSCGHSKCG